MQETEIWVGRPTRESLAFLETALERSGEADSPDRSRLLAGLAKALSDLGDTDRAAELLVDAADMARRCGDRQALYGALNRQNTAAIGRGCSASHFAERYRILDEIAALTGEAYDAHDHLAWGLGPAAAYLEMGDGAGFVTALSRFREYSTKHRISTLEWALTSADAMHAILLGEFAEAERLA